MKYNFVAYDGLRTSTLEAIKTVATTHHHPNIQELKAAYEKGEPDAADLAKTFSGIPPLRRTQIEFLLTMIFLLDKADELDEVKSQILSAAICYVRWDIEEDFKVNGASKNLYRFLVNAAASVVTSPQNSTFHISLGFALKLGPLTPGSPDNALTSSDLLGIYGLLQNFVMSHTYKNPQKPLEGFLPKEKQFFSPTRIENFSVTTFIKNLDKLIQELHSSIVDAADKAAKWDNARRVNSSLLTATPAGDVSKRTKQVVPQQAQPAASDAQAQPAASDAQAEPAASDAQAEPAASEAQAEPAALDAQAEPAALDAQAEPAASGEQAESAASGEQAESAASGEQAQSRSPEAQGPSAGKKKKKKGNNPNPQGFFAGNNSTATTTATNETLAASGVSKSA